MGPENEALVRIEIDGENPLRDRREALERALSHTLKKQTLGLESDSAQAPGVCCDHRWSDTQYAGDADRD